MYVLIDNYDSFTYNLFQYLSELTDQEIRVYRNDRIDVDGIAALRPAGIVISPGPGRPEDAGVSLAAIRRFAGEVPILGVCLGHQAIGAAFGGRIIPAKAIVHGKTDAITSDGRGVFRGIPSPAIFTRYHSLVIDPETVPDGFAVTARSADGEIMGIRHERCVVEGVQFHPESIASDHGRRLLANFLNYKREPLDVPGLLNRVAAGADLTQEQAAEFMEELTDGNLNTAQIAGFLVALNAKGYAAAEIAGCASVLRRKKTPLAAAGEFLDTCGTGGAGTGSFNISSMAALIACAAGARVAKHGNRSFTRKSGSADFFAALGVRSDLDPAASAELLAGTGFAFLFAPTYHGSMRHAAPVRQELGIKTVMNLLGPLANPAGAAWQVIGVYDGALCRVVAEAARLLGVRRVMTVHGDDGGDEISVTGPTRAVLIDESGRAEELRLTPEALGIGRHERGAVAGGTPAENVAQARELMAGAGRPALRDAVAVNAGAALHVCGLAADLRAGVRTARQALESGAVARKVDEITALAAALAERAAAASTDGASTGGGGGGSPS